MWHWIVFTVLILAVPCYFAALQWRELVRDYRSGRLRCPLRPKPRRDTLKFAE